MKTITKTHIKWVFLFLAFLSCGVIHAEESKARELLATVVLTSGEEQTQAIERLADEGDKIILTVIDAWRVGRIFTYSSDDGTTLALLKTQGNFTNIATGESLDPGGAAKVIRPSRRLRKRLSSIVNFLDLSSPDMKERIYAAEKLGLSQKPEYVEVLRKYVGKQTDEKVKKAFVSALNISLLKNSDTAGRLQAIKDLGELESLPSRDFIATLVKENEEVLTSEDSTRLEKDDAKELIAASKAALQKIDSHQRVVEIYGSVLRGLSLGSILLLVSYGLAITFGLMGVINMAHGEFIAIGGYTVYLIQGYFAQTYGVGSAGYEWYFIVALPASFLVAAFFGVILERGVIQFLYRRPLESLLATWGISMVFQQLIRLKFGAANVAVASPRWLAGGYEIGDVSMSYNRIVVIAFAILVLIGTWLLLTKTSWGLHVRATMQNRLMASSLGVKSARVNMMTFAFGSGLAGLAGAFLSQIGNVGPSMGQTYVVDSFMVVVVGGVGNLLGAALSSMGIGMLDQALQPILGPVMGKISVLLGIILFLQLKPGGLFPSKSRSLED